MPIYEYQCSNCHHTFDLIQKMSDEPASMCPACSKETAVRLVSAAGFQLKGTGWYATDFKTKNQPEKHTNTGKKIEKVSATSEKVSGTSDSSGSSEKKSTESTVSLKKNKDE